MECIIKLKWVTGKICSTDDEVFYTGTYLMVELNETVVEME